MRLSRALVLGFAFLIAGTAAAGERVEIQVRLVLVDQCTIDAGERTHADKVEVECSSEQPYQLDSPVTRTSRAVLAGDTFPDGQPPQRPGPTITF